MSSLRSVRPLLLFLLKASVMGLCFADASESSSYALDPAMDARGPGFTPMNLNGEITSVGNRIRPLLYRTNQVLLNGSGVSLGDVNGDGKTDIFATRSDGANQLLLNQGNWRFSSEASVKDACLPNAYSTGSVLVDLDGDEDLDLLVATIQRGTFLFENDGRGRLIDVSAASGIESSLGGMSITVGDYDLDGRLDFYVAHYRASALMDIPNARMNLGVKDGRKIITHFNGRSMESPDLKNRFYIDERGGIGEYGEIDHLYRNRGGLRFEKIEFTQGAFLSEDGTPLTTPLFDWGLAAAFRDLNQDGLPDLYVCNDFDTPDRIWLNQGRGVFRLLAETAMRQSSWFSMGVDFADLNRDGWDDFLTLDMMATSHEGRMTQLGDIAPAQHLIKNPVARPQFLKTCLFLNQGDGHYLEMAYAGGVAATDWAWCPAFVDVDLDGFEDLLVTNGNERDGRNLDVEAILTRLRAEKAMSDDQIFTERMRFSRLPSANLAYRGTGDGRFSTVDGDWGFGHVGVSHGMALGDLDGDGDLDAVVSHLNEPLGFYRNDATNDRIQVRLKGSGENTSGIGARIRLTAGDFVQEQEVMAGGRYLSSDESIRVFAVPDTGARLKLEVKWPSGLTSTVDDVDSNTGYLVAEPKGAGDANENPIDSQGTEAWFEEVSDLFGFEHGRQDFDDFARQPLLLRRYSDLGPGVSCYDIDADGFDDVIVGTGRSGRLGVFRNNNGTAFAAYGRAPFDQVSSRDTTSVLGVHLRARDPSIMIGLSNYEDGLAVGASVGLYRFRGAAPVVIRGGAESSVGPLAFCDWDQDGDLDLFVGGRFVPGKIPRAGRTVLLVNEGRHFAEVSAIGPDLERIGMVSGAVFSDIDNDRDPDLVLAMDWGAIELFLNQEGQFVRATRAWGLEAYQGWWNGIATGDFDRDGKMDLVATNWGWNTPYQRYQSRPLHLYHGDFDRNGQYEMILGAFDSKLSREVPIRQRGILASGLPGLVQAFPTHLQFAQAAVGDLLQGFDVEPERRSAGWMASTVFLNRGDRFEPRPLPLEAQLSPAFGVSIADFDADGFLDLFLAQNFFGVRRDVARYDGGSGLILRGNGDGGFVGIRASESGIRIFGEQRGTAVADLDRDGRVDLVVGQNGGPVRVYRNRRPQGGLRVRLRGDAGNPDGVGARLWLSDGEVEGSRIEIQSGSGFLSQNSSRPVLTMAGPASQLHVRWPDGTEVTYPIEASDRDLVVDPQGRREEAD